MKDPVERFIDLLRDSHHSMVRIYTEGACFHLYRILREIWPEAEPWFDNDHVFTKIGPYWYDIEGKHLRPLEDMKPMPADQQKKAFKWAKKAGSYIEICR